MASVLPALAIDVSANALSNVATLFPHIPSRVSLEIGFGGGEHLIADAQREPDTGFIGVEPFLNGMARAVTEISERGLRNVRLFQADAALLLQWLPPRSLDAVDLLYPDPWPKKRHWKRRFVSPENLNHIARALKKGGTFCFASDIPGYVEWTLAHLTRDDRFAWTAETAEDWTKPFAGWTGTRYEAKAIREGRMPTYLEFQRK